jgi:8-oxo-dGTP pyrophosphatase MutT (NUDIX family)
MVLKLHHRLQQKAYLTFSRLTRGMTLGVRAMLISGDAVVLVKHSYIPGWHFPGGGVEPGESVAEALRREIGEEAGAALAGEPQLFGVYRNRVKRSDHVAFYVCREWTIAEAPSLPNGEIVACRQVALDALPDDTSPATLARIREVIGGEQPSADW